MNNHTHWRKAFKSDYLGAHDLEEGQDLKLTIKQVTVRPVTNPTGKTEDCNVATFTDPKLKPMVLNATACKQIQRFSGSKFIEDWGNTNIQIYVLEGVKAYGEVHDVLRIRDMQPRMEKPVLNNLSEKWDDAIKSYQDAENKDKQIGVIRKHYDLSDQDLALLIQASTEQKNAA